MSQLPSAVNVILAAATNLDEPGFLDCFTADGVVYDWGREFCGRSEIHTWSTHEFIGVRVHEVLSFETHGTVLTISANVGGDATPVRVISHSRRGDGPRRGGPFAGAEG